MISPQIDPERCLFELTVKCFIFFETLNFRIVCHSLLFLNVIMALRKLLAALQLLILSTWAVPVREEQSVALQQADIIDSAIDLAGK